MKLFYITKRVVNRIIGIYDEYVWRHCLRMYQMYKLNKIRAKEKIKFVFIVNDVSVWKTEALYLYLMQHPRFEPLLVISPSRETPDAHIKMMEYLSQKKYPFYQLKLERDVISQVHPDILMYEKPYEGCVEKNHIARKNRKTVLVHVPYGFTNTMEPWNYNLYIYRRCLQYYHENSVCAKATIDHLKGNSSSVVVTGIPMMDELMKPKDSFVNPWHDKKNRKKIIYAPHHTIGDNHLSGIAYSTFLSYADYMLELARKYSEQTYWAFKPHPLLKQKLELVWGKDKAEEYYRAWDELENAQVEVGRYVGLFKHSDAMIHDCSTFTQEYMYANRPVMYLLRGEHHADNLNPFARATFELHVHGRSCEDIENFVLDVINDVDVKKSEREQFYLSEMLPPHGKTACENIVNCILGQAEYKSK